MSLGGLMAGTHAELVGVEEQDDGGLRLYLGHRSNGLYALIYDEEAKRETRAVWAGSGARITVPTPPPGCVFCEAGEDRDGA